MEIPEKLIKKWQALKSPGDADKMAEKLEGSAAETFNRAFREGEHTIDTSIRSRHTRNA